MFKIHSANPLVLLEFNSTAGRKSMPEFSSQCRGRKSRNQQINVPSSESIAPFSKRCGTLFKDILHTLISTFSPEMPCSGQRPLRTYHTEKESMFTQCFIVNKMQSFWEVLCIIIARHFIHHVYLVQKARVVNKSAQIMGCGVTMWEGPMLANQHQADEWPCGKTNHF